MGVRALVLSGAILIGGVLVAGPAAADEPVIVSSCLDAININMEQVEAASSNLSLAQADERAGQLSLDDLDQRTEDANMSTIEQLTSTMGTGLSVTDARTTAWDVHCTM
jgi:hypothetical protein